MSNELKNFLVLIRHGQSEWNEKNLFTGWKNPPLTRLGELEAERAGSKIKSLKIDFDIHFTSELIRAQSTGIIIQKIIEKNINTIKNIALNERDYGDLSGLNKDEARKSGEMNRFIFGVDLMTYPHREAKVSKILLIE